MTTKTRDAGAARRLGTRALLAAGMGLLPLGLTGYALLLQSGAGFLIAVLLPSRAFAVGLSAVFVGSTASAAWTVSHASAVGALADGLRIGFAAAGGLAVLGIVCALVVFTGRRPEQAASLVQQQGATQR